MTLDLSTLEAQLVVDAIRTRVRTLGPWTEPAAVLQGVLARMNEARVAAAAEVVDKTMDLRQKDGGF